MCCTRLGKSSVSSSSSRLVASVELRTPPIRFASLSRARSYLDLGSVGGTGSTKDNQIRATLNLLSGASTGGGQRQVIPLSRARCVAKAIGGTASGWARSTWVVWGSGQGGDTEVTEGKAKFATAGICKILIWQCTKRTG